MVLKISQNMDNVWVSNGFDNKTKIQKLVFLEGIAYDRQKTNFEFLGSIPFSL